MVIDNMKALVTGALGQLGHDVCLEIGGSAIGIDIDELDITDKVATQEFIKKLRPDVIIHCAAYTAVDKAETEPELCHAVNVLGTQSIAEAAKSIDAKLLYLSTDYVYDGAQDHPYEISDTPNPLGVYGQTKLDGEKVIMGVLEKFFVVRTSWVFGANGGNFVKTMLRLGRENCAVRVVADQVGSPTYTRDLASLIFAMIRTENYGIYHATNEGYCSWYEFACRIFNTASMNVMVSPISTSEYPTVAIRPSNSRLSKKSLANAGFKLLPSWQDALERFIVESHQ